jgi:transcriptional regulator with XRE-family HTH domain
MEVARLDERQVGKNIKKIRKEMGLSLNELADMIGMTKGYISKIENSDSAPPISTLSKIAISLGVEVSVLTAEELDLPQPMKVCVTKKGEGKKLSSGGMTGYHYEILAHKKSGKNMEPMLLSPSFDEEAIFSHEGEEFMYTIEGTHEVIYDGESYIIDAGDSIYFDSIVPHTGRSIGKTKAKVLAVSYSYKRDSNMVVTNRIKERKSKT